MTKSRKFIPMRSKRVLAIDPGFDRLGLAILERNTLLHSECIVTKPKDSHDKRLLVIGEKLRETIEKWQPKELAIETLFFNQNTTSALKVAEARGVALYEAARAGLSVFEYSPQAIKIAVTGYGKADKIQVGMMVKRLVQLPLKDRKMLDDELDAIALGITHLATRRSI
ncbi:MAG: Crossover junction endodeoxyribonuclease RuvC [Parcubacteria group bacterium GW2011_GWB1_49_7]|nr:MAG: Crossover junction endodeoxyribonuclease RuvC [Parcubacteria group bacterium GW2011_GWA1_47_10]KKW09605.1 MAG: Crossover junction endodeoxyribonuclease RuvC [Parcubacteria group bacterium GW2011_GWB1_49_7]